MDPIANFLVQIKNAQAVKHETVKVSFSKIRYELARILAKEGFIKKVKKKGRKQKHLLITLDYENGKPKITNLKRVSKPGQRFYTSAKDLKPVRGGYGISIVSTSKGLMTNKEARKKNLGGEIICEVW